MRLTVSQLIVHEFLRHSTRLIATIYFRFRVFGIANYPKEDGFLVCCNHQSHLDPVLVGLTLPRSVATVGRATLTKFKLFGSMLRFFNLIAIDRDGGGTSGLKETIRRLKQKDTVVIFPEGTRTRDGELQAIKMGFAMLARKVKAPILPMALDGSFQAMPRSSWFIRPTRIYVVIGKPIPESEYGLLSDEELGQLLTKRIAECFNEARRRRNR
jgi:1-acyl-sn-glycerol-3-phosphate acyltransferase